MISQCHGEEEGRQSDAPAGRRQHLQVNIDSLSGRAGGRRIEGDRERERERERERWEEGGVDCHHSAIIQQADLIRFDSTQPTNPRFDV